MTKQELYRFTQKVYARLRDPEFDIKLFRSKDTLGLCHFDKKCIEINPKSDMLSTLLHEMLHSINPEWSEEKVLQQEAIIMKQLSHRQMANLMLAFGEALKRYYK